ncbi:MAG: dimethyl sulfoxide reductase anchor subunit [Planctomycetes bacterium]|nr:dimethyl sulfoxide reductase anchor subunit [Planctomycetota bacterium]
MTSSGLKNRTCRSFSMTVFSQLGFGGFVVVFVLDLVLTLSASAAAMGQALGWVAPALMVVVGLSLNIALFHLGRPAFALRSLRNIKNSWLSREIVGLGLFAPAATGYSLVLFLTEGVSWIALERLGGPFFRIVLGVAMTQFGIAGVYSSSMLYRVPARRAWDGVKTTIDFFDVALMLGLAFYGVAASSALLLGVTEEHYLRSSSSLCAAASLVAFSVKNLKNSYFLRKWMGSDVFELSASAELWTNTFGRLRMIKNVLGVLASLMLFRLLKGWKPPRACLSPLSMYGCCSCR